jgi:hypothetical protein
MSYGSKDWQKWVEAKALPLLEHAYKAGINTWDTVHSAILSPYLSQKITSGRLMVFIWLQFITHAIAG